MNEINLTTFYEIRQFFDKRSSLNSSATDSSSFPDNNIYLYIYFARCYIYNEIKVEFEVKVIFRDRIDVSYNLWLAKGRWMPGKFNDKWNLYPSFFHLGLQYISKWIGRATTQWNYRTAVKYSNNSDTCVNNWQSKWITLIFSKRSGSVKEAEICYQCVMT